MSCNVFHIIGNGSMETTEKTISSFDKINAAGSAEVRFYKSNEFKVIYTIDSNLTEYVEIYTSGSTLNIGMKNGYSYSYSKKIVEIYCPDVTGITMSGSGFFIAEDTITAPSFSAIVSGSGKVEGKFETSNFSAKISGSGKINITGNSNSSNIEISGSGNINAVNFPVKTADIKISGSGRADIHVTDRLKANISGSGRVNYIGNPVVESSISGSGKIGKI